MNNPFGPQTSSAATALPSGNTQNRYGAVETWCRECKADGTGGTVLDAAYYNNIHGNLNYLVNMAKLTSANRGDMSVVYRAILKLIEDRIPTVRLTGTFGDEVGDLGSTGG